MITLKKTYNFCRDSIVFLGSILVSMTILYPFAGIQGSIAWASLGVLSTFSLYNAKPDKSNPLYVLCWMIVIMSSVYIGRFLHLTPFFYLFLLSITYCYYFFFGRDPVFDRAFRFIIILSTIGTTMPHITNGLPLGASVGVLTALTICHFIKHKSHDLEAFKEGVFNHKLFKLKTHLIPRAFVYSLGMFTCLWLPLYLGLNKNYWATLTFVVVMTPKADNVFHNTVLRFSGSFLAVILLYFIFQLPDIKTVITISFFVFSFLLPMFFGKNFGVVSFFVTCYSLTLIEIAGYWANPTFSLLYDRLIETFIGGLTAICASFILNWMRKQ